MAELSRERRHWEDLASSDPMWVILTEPGREGQWDEEEFFRSGQAEIAGVFDALARMNLEPRRGAAVDFGCGLGRLSQALAERFDQVHGVDISQAMVAEATARNRHGARVRYHANALDRLPMLADASVDFIYSRITLQHIPRAAAESYIAEFGRALAPGGVCVFQVLVRARSRAVRARHALRNAFPGLYRWARDVVLRRSKWELNVVPEATVTAILERAGVRVQAVVTDESAGPMFESRTFFGVKPARP